MAGTAYPERPDGYKNYYLLSSAVLGAKSDDYEPVRFSHRIHDELTGGDCGVCHHRYATAAEDRVGVDIKDLHAPMEIKMGGVLCSCHDDMAKNPPQSCARCHGLPNETDAPSRIGLKGAYHRQCIGCHERQLKPAFAPTECAACHHPWTPDHSTLVAFTGKPSPQDVTRNCLSCHPKVGQDVLKTAHWNWKGYSPTLKGYEHRIDISLTLMVNNSCIAIGPNLQECASCHIGYGWVDAKFDFTNPANIDCLVCHDTTGTYRKDPGKGGLPDPSLDLAAIAKKVGRPSRQACGSCHFASGGAPYAKHGDLEPAAGRPAGRLRHAHGHAEDALPGLPCDHRAPDRGDVDERPRRRGPRPLRKVPRPNAPRGGGHAEPPSGRPRQGRCVRDLPHSLHCEGVTDSPAAGLFASGSEPSPSGWTSTGCRSTTRNSATLTWGKHLVPTYLWYDGTRNASLVGDKIDPSSAVVLNAPVGEKRNPSARIFPFQVHAAVQPYDTENKILALPKLLDGYWVDFDWSKAIASGMKQVGLPYSGKYGFVETKMYSSIHHEVVPAKKALGCSDCHSAGGRHLHALPQEREGDGPSRAPARGLSGGDTSARFQRLGLPRRSGPRRRAVLHRHRSRRAAEIASRSGLSNWQYL